MRWSLLLWVVCAACSGGGAEIDDARLGDEDAGIVLEDASLDAVPADPTQSTIEVDKTSAVAGEEITATVTARDSAGSPIVAASVQLVATGTGTFVAQAPPTDGAGVTTTTWTSPLAGPIGISAVINGIPVTGPTVMFAPGPAAKLGFAQQPGNVIAGAPFSPAIVVETQDANGNLVDTDTGFVILTLDANPGSTSVGGTVFAAVENGTAVFSAAHVDVAAMDYSLRAQSTDGLTAGTSTFFDVSWGDPSATHSTISAAPTSLEANGIDTTEVSFTVANAYAVAIPGFTASLTVSGTNNTLVLASGTTNSDGELVATLSSSTAEVKTVTGTAGQTMAMGSVYFFGPSCAPQLPGIESTPVEDFTSAFHVADVDGDGVRDAIVTVSQDHELHVFLGLGDGTFAPAIRVVLGVGTVSDLESGDFNTDGHRDLVLSISGTSALTFLLGDGTGLFPTTLTSALPNDPTGLVVANFDGNSALDVLVTVPNSQKMYARLGVGDGTFTAGGTIDGGGSYLAVVDANSDGALDVMFSGSDTRIALGAGNGTFQSPTLATASGGLILAGDFNADSKPDVAIASFDGLLTPYLGNGNGTFTAASVGVAYRGVSQTFSAAGGGVRDLDGDSKLDLVVSAGLTTSVLKGSGTGTFTTTRTYFASTETLAEMTGDSHVDLVGRMGFTVAVVAGTSSTAFVAPTELLRNQAISTRLYDATADFDSNGRVDYVRLRSAPTSAMSVMLTQLDGSIVEASSSAATSSPYDAVAGDFSGDGKPDVAIVDGAVSGVTLGLALGNGTGSLSAFSTQDVATPYVTNLDPGDFDQDGKQDLVLTRSQTAGVSIALSTGTGFGTPETYSSPPVDTVLVRDVSQDGVPDVVVFGGSGFSAEIRVFLTTDTGTLTPFSYGTGGLTGVIGVGDFTSDGIVDLVFLQGDFLATPRAVLVYPGLGGGVFGEPLSTPNVRLPAHFNYETMHVADVTNDGDVDLLVNSTYGTAVIAGFGDGYVRQTPRYYAAGIQGGSQTDPVVLTDHDVNGRPDLVFWRAGLVLATNAGCVP